MVCANAGYLLSHPSTGVRRADYFYSSTEKSSAQRFEIKTKDMGTTPHKTVGVGSLTTNIAPVSAYLRWYDTMYTEDKHERVNTQETKRLQFKWWTYNAKKLRQKKKLRRALRTAIKT